MSRLAISLTLVLVLASTWTRLLDAQAAVRTHAIPTRDALRGGARPSDIHPSGAEAAVIAEPRTAVPDVDAIITQRGRFAKAGVITGMAAATVWAYRSARLDGFGMLTLPFVLPILWIPSGVAGGAVGYGVSFIFYPPERVNRSML